MQSSVSCIKEGLCEPRQFLVHSIRQNTHQYSSWLQLQLVYATTYNNDGRRQHLLLYSDQSDCQERSEQYHQLVCKPVSGQGSDQEHLQIHQQQLCDCVQETWQELLQYHQPVPIKV